MCGTYWSILIVLYACVVSGNPVSRAHRSQLCFEPLGCFSNESPFNNTDGILPMSPAEIDTTFRLFTRTCRSPVIVTHENVADFTGCSFNPNNPTKVIVHGFLQHGQVSWVVNMANQLLTKGDMNVITVDWGHGSGIPYHQAAANTRVVGAAVGQMINFLLDSFSVSSANVHLIGHSLGAHVCGYAGGRVSELGRITGPEAVLQITSTFIPPTKSFKRQYDCR